MNWEIVGSTGEWVGASVVVATLFYLSRQIRQQNQAARYNAFKDIMDAINQPNQLLASNSEMRSVFARGLEDPQTLSDEEASQFSWTFRLYWNQMLKFHRAYDAGIIEEKDWSDLAPHLSQLLFSPGGTLFLEEQGNVVLDVVSAYRCVFVPGEKLYDVTMGRGKPPSDKPM